MKQLHEFTWFDEAHATKVRNAVRDLVRLYAEAYEAVTDAPRSVWRTNLGGPRNYRPLLIVRFLLRDVVADHVRAVLASTDILKVREFIAARPIPAELKFSAAKRPTPEQKAETEKQLAEFLRRQARIAALFGEAFGDIRSLLELVGATETVGRRVFAALMRFVRRLLPFAWSAWVIAQFEQWSNAPPYQLLFFFFGVVIVYHLLAWLTLPFHDAAERKYVYFEGYLGSPTDGLKPLFPPPSRLEDTLFGLLKLKRPIIISWDTIVPLIHYGLISGLILIMLAKLNFSALAALFAWMGGGLLIAVYAWQLYWLARLLALRYHGRSFFEVIFALIIATGQIVPLQEIANDSDSRAGKDS